jgi:hypothetical protein
MKVTSLLYGSNLHQLENYNKVLPIDGGMTL